MSGKRQKRWQEVSEEEVELRRGWGGSSRRGRPKKFKLHHAEILAISHGCHLNKGKEHK